MTLNIINTIHLYACAKSQFRTYSDTLKNDVYDVSKIEYNHRPQELRNAILVVQAIDGVNKSGSSRVPNGCPYYRISDGKQVTCVLLSTLLNMDTSI
ncbi:hypothetical protein TNCV_4538071 [Trichonephila clavipes]|nr:hypothetical protein TNCV_4538071 [Trichonephila clavipes]